MAPHRDQPVLGIVAERRSPVSYTPRDRVVVGIVAVLACGGSASAVAAPSLIL
jgi:hypothetical protein